MLSGITRTKHNPSPLLLTIAQSRPEAALDLGLRLSVDSRGRALFVADVHREENWRFIARADGKLTVFVELESAIRTRGELA